MKPNFFSNIGKRHLFGVDLSINQFRIAELDYSSADKELVSFMSENIAGLNELAVSDKIKEKFPALKIKNQAVMLILPSHQAITKNIEIPSRDPDEIKEIINLQAGRHTPFTREEIIVDYIEIGTYRKSYTKILLVIVNRSVIKKQVDILEAAGLKAKKVLLSCEGVGQYCWKALAQDNSNPIGILHVDYGYTDFSIILQGRPIFIRNIPVGSHHLSEKKDQYHDVFIEEIKKSLAVYKNEDIESAPEYFVLVGAIGKITEMEYIVQKNVGISVKVIPQANQLIRLHGGVDFVDFTGEISCFHIAASLATQEETRINLIPEEIKVRRSIEEKGKEIIRTGISIMSIVILVLLLFLTNIYIKTAYLNEVSWRYQYLGKESKDLEKKFVKIKMVRHHLRNRGQALRVLSELHQVTPPEIYFYHIALESDGRISLKGISDAYSSVYNFVALLESSPVFRNVGSRYAGTRREGDKDIVDFEINCLLVTEPE